MRVSYCTGWLCTELFTVFDKSCDLKKMLYAHSSDYKKGPTERNKLSNLFMNLNSINIVYDLIEISCFVSITNEQNTCFVFSVLNPINTSIFQLSDHRVSESFCSERKSQAVISLANGYFIQLIQHHSTRQSIRLQSYNLGRVLILNVWYNCDTGLPFAMVQSSPLFAL